MGWDGMVWDMSTIGRFTVSEYLLDILQDWRDVCMFYINGEYFHGGSEPFRTIPLFAHDFISNVRRSQKSKRKEGRPHLRKDYTRRTDGKTERKLRMTYLLLHWPDCVWDIVVPSVQTACALHLTCFGWKCRLGLRRVWVGVEAKLFWR